MHWGRALAAICLLAAGLRLIGLTYGLPAVYNPDETPILNRALAFAKGDPRPQNYVYPSLYFYLQFVWQGLFFIGGWITGAFASVAEFQRQFFLDPSGHFLAGRVFSVICGTLTVLATYAFGRRLYDRTTGLIGAAALAVAPVAVRDAHYVKLDVPTAMFVAFAHVALARLVVDPAAAGRRGPWIIAGLLSGLAVSTQYYAVFLAFTMLAVAFVDWRRTARLKDSGRLFLYATGAAIVGFFLGTPFILFDLQRAAADIAHVREVDVDRALAGGSFVSTGAYLRILLWDATGWPVCVAAAVGAVWATVADWRRGLLLVSFFVPFFAFIANTVPMSRYLNVVLPIIAVAAAFTLARLSRSLPRYAAVPVLVLALVPGFVTSLKTDLFFRHADTRTLAADFIRERIPAGSSLLVQPYGPPLRQSREALVEALRANLGDEGRASTKFQLMLALEPYPAPSYRTLYLGDGGLDVDKIYVLPDAFTGHSGLAPLREARVDYVVLKGTNVGNPETAGLERALAREGRLVARFSPYHPDASARDRAAVPPFLHNTSAVYHPALARPGPTIDIWAVAQPAPE